MSCREKLVRLTPCGVLLLAVTASWLAVPRAACAQPGCSTSEWSGRWFEQAQECIFFMTSHTCEGVSIRCPPMN